MFDYEQFERLTGQRLADYALTTSRESLPTGFVEYVRDNAARLDGQHLEMAILLLEKIGTDTARHEIANHLGHSLKHIRLTVIGLLDRIGRIDEHVRARVEERLHAVKDESEVRLLDRLRNKERN
jgi:hypothetical protein